MQTKTIRVDIDVWQELIELKHQFHINNMNLLILRILKERRFKPKCGY